MASAADQGAKENVEIHMFRGNLEDVPEAPVPPGFSLRQGPDPASWVAIQSAAEPFLNISLEGSQEGAWQHEFQPGEGNLPAFEEDGSAVSFEEAMRYQFFMIEDATGRAVGTATGWRTKHQSAYAEMMTKRAYWALSLATEDADVQRVDLAQDGLVHWLAVHPDYQGRGLSKPLLSAVLRSLGKEGLNCKTATLGTGSGRPQAIPLYLSYGFEPMVFGIEDFQAWRDLYHAAVDRHAETLALGEDCPADERSRRSDRVLVEKLRPVSLVELELG